MRYALPLLAPVAYLFVRGAQALRVSPFAEIAVVAVALVLTVPQATGFAKGSPGDHGNDRRDGEWRPDRRAMPGCAGSMNGSRSQFEPARRSPEGAKAGFMRAPHGFEWLTLVEEWRRNPSSNVQFVANPRRTDYKTLFDPYSRHEITQVPMAVHGVAASRRRTSGRGGPRGVLATRMDARSRLGGQRGGSGNDRGGGLRSAPSSEHCLGARA